MLYTEIIAVCSQIHTKNIHCVGWTWNYWIINLVVHIVTTGLWKFNMTSRYEGIAILTTLVQYTDQDGVVETPSETPFCPQCAICHAHKHSMGHCTQCRRHSVTQMYLKCALNVCVQSRGFVQTALNQGCVKITPRQYTQCHGLYCAQRIKSNTNIWWKSRLSSLEVTLYSVCLSVCLRRQFLF
jgi:hypothetical protein